MLHLRQNADNFYFNALKSANTTDSFNHIFQFYINDYSFVLLELQDFDEERKLSSPYTIQKIDT